MSCNQSTIISDNLIVPNDDTHDDGWHAVDDIILSALTQYYPVSQIVLPIPNVCTERKQPFTVVQLDVETGGTGGHIKPDLLLMCYTDATPTAPVSGVVYEGDPNNLIGIIRIATADFTDRVSTNVWRASVTVNDVWFSGLLATATNLYIAVISDKAAGQTFANTPTLRFKITTKV